MIRTLEEVGGPGRPQRSLRRSDRGMLTAVGRRVLSAALVVIGVVTVVFVIQRLVSDPLAPYVSGGMSQAEIDKLRVTLGFDRPLLVQYVDFVGGIATGNPGTSRVYGVPVLDVILQALPVTLTVVLLALLLALLVGAVVGMLAAVYRGRWIDSVVMTLSMIGQALPAFWLGILLILVFSVLLNWLPSGGYGTYAQLVLPVLALSANSANQFARVVRAEMIDVLGQDYIRTAYAQGVAPARIFFRHAFRNSLLPVVTVLGVQLTIMIAGTVVVEVVFSLPGVSRLLFTSIQQSDYAVTQAIAIYAAVIVTVVNLLVDLSYTWLDPRITFGARR